MSWAGCSWTFSTDRCGQHCLPVSSSSQAFVPQRTRREREKNTLLLIRPCESHPLHISYATSMEEALGLSLQASAASLAAGGWLGGRVLESRLARLQVARATVSGLATAGVLATFSGSTAQRRRGGLGRLSCSPTGESGRWQGGAQAAA
jgi:hypothetical protein